MINLSVNAEKSPMFVYIEVLQQRMKAFLKLLLLSEKDTSNYKYWIYVDSFFWHFKMKQHSSSYINYATVIKYANIINNDYKVLYNVDKFVCSKFDFPFISNNQ